MRRPLRLMKKFYHKTEKLAIYKLKIMHYTSEQPRKNPANLFAGRFLCFCFCKTFSEQYIYKYRYRRQHHQRNDQATVSAGYRQRQQQLRPPNKREKQQS